MRENELHPGTQSSTVLIQRRIVSEDVEDEEKTEEHQESDLVIHQALQEWQWMNGTYHQFTKEDPGIFPVCIMLHEWMMKWIQGWMSVNQVMDAGLWQDGRREETM